MKREEIKRKERKLKRTPPRSVAALLRTSSVAGARACPKSSASAITNKPNPLRLGDLLLRRKGEGGGTHPAYRNPLYDRKPKETRSVGSFRGNQTRNETKTHHLRSRGPS